MKIPTWTHKPARLLWAYLLRKLNAGTRYQLAMWMISAACRDVMQGEQQSQWAMMIKGVADGVQKAQQSGQRKVRTTIKLKQGAMNGNRAAS